jgi:hypothetical protein
VSDPERITAADARRMLLGRQGLLADPARRATPATVYRQIERMGFVQVDTINAVERAHHHILMTRFDGYRPEMLATLLERRRLLFEHWTHDASVIPTCWMPHWRSRFARYEASMRARPYWAQRFKGEIDRNLDEVRERIQRDGPLRSRDFDRPRRKEGEPSGFWNWPPHKAALEWLWRTGELSISARDGFQKVYDLTARVFPDFGHAPTPGEDETVDWACRTAFDRLGMASAAEIATFMDAIPVAAARAWCESAVLRGEIEPVEIECADGSRPRAAFAQSCWRRRVRDAGAARGRIRLLSPFDPVIRDRKRTLRLFGFDYTIEVFVPEARRRYGYFVLPALEGDRFAGRVDAKLHRDRGVLELRGLWWEDGVRVTAKRRKSLLAAAERLAGQIGATRIELCRRARAAL